MSEPVKRGTRRNLASQPIPRGGRHNTRPDKPSPITPDELADIIAQARAQRIEDDIRDYAERKAS